MIDNAKSQVLENELKKVSIVLKEKILENEQLKGITQKFEVNLKQSTYNFEKQIKDNDMRNRSIQGEFEKVTTVLKEKVKESEDLKMALQKLDALIKDKNQQNIELANKCQQLANILHHKQVEEQKIVESERRCQELRAELEKLNNILKEKVTELDQLKRQYTLVDQAIKER